MLFRFRPDFKCGDKQVHAAIAVQIIGDHIARVLFKRHACQMANFQKRFAVLIKKEPVFS